MSFIQNLFLSRDNNANGANYIGQQDRIWWNPDTNAFYYSDGNTPGGILISTGGGGNGVPGGPTNSIQINAGNGSFTGSSNLTFNGTVVSIVGNVSANYFIGDGSQLTNLPTNNYGNSNVAAYLPTDTTIININSNIANTNSNLANLTLIVANNSSNITTLQGLVYSNANVANYLPIYSGNISGGNIGLSGNINAVGDITSFANIVASPGGYFQGDGSQLTNLPIQPGTYSNTNVASYLTIYSGNIAANVISATGNVIASGGNTVIDDGISTTGNIVGNNISTQGNVTSGNILTNNYLYSNGNSIFANIVLSGNVDLGNLYIIDETIFGKNINANIGISPEGSGWVTLPRVSIDTLTIANTTGKMEFITPAGVDIQLTPGTAGNILTAGNVEPTANNIASLGSANHRYIGLWLGSGNINLIDQGIGVNQEIYVNNGNVILGNNAGLYTGNFQITDNSILLSNVAANMVIGNASSNAWVQFNRSIAVETTVGETAFSVSKNGFTNIFTPSTIAPTSAALNVVGTSSGNVQPRNFTGTMLQITGQDNSPTRISFDAFGANGAQNSYVAIAGRAARGNVDSPQALQTNDLMTRITSQGWTGNGSYAPSIARLNFAAAENFTSNASVGTYANIQLTPIGSNVIKTVTGFNGYGVNFPNVSTGGTGNLGITFQDGTFQNTAYGPTTVVGSATAATGILISPVNTSATGNITITNTGVINVAGTSNQIFVNGANIIAPANGVVQLSLPQDIATSSSPTFNTLTVNDLVILGNVSNVIPSVVSGKVVYVANTATQLSDINISGLISGNAANGYYAGILYNTTSNTWDMSIGNSQGITADFVDTGNANIEIQLHVGNAVAHLDYPYAVIQGDMDVDSYTQIVFQNHNQGANASADFVAVNNIGNDGNNYIDMGINSNVYNNSDYVVTGPNDGYLYVNGGNLVIGTQTPTNIIKFFTGGTNSASYVRATITDIGLSVVGNIYSANAISSNLVTGVTISASGNVVGNNLISLNTVSAQGNVIAQNVNTGIVSATGNVIAGNVRTAGSVSAIGNIYGANLVTATTIIDGGVSTSGNVTGNAIIATTVSATGNINGANIVANLAIISSTLSILGNIQGGNLLTSGLLSTTGNVGAGNINTAGRVVVTGNVDSGNLRTSGTVNAATVSTTGNITASYYFGNGSQLTGLNAYQTVAANGVNLLSNSTSGVLTLTPGNNFIITGNSSTDTVTMSVSQSPSFTGNVQAGNIRTTGIVSATGNITGNYFVGNGSLLTGLVFTSNLSILPNALSSTVHIAVSTVGNVATIITDATTANTANTIVVRNQFGGISVDSWNIAARTVGVDTTLNGTDYWIGLTAKNLTITLPNAANGAVQGRQYIIADQVLSGAPGDTINTQAGATVSNGTLTQQGQSKMCVFIAATNTWYCN